MTRPEEFVGSTFTSSEEETRRFAEYVLAYADASKPLRILEIGCGDGRLMFTLGEKLGAACFTGIDLSSLNIESARHRVETIENKHRFDFICADYNHHVSGPYDLIMAFSSLQHIEAPFDTLSEKIALSLSPGGVFIVSMPYECFHNKILYLLRKFLRKIRGPFSDRVLLSVACLLHGRRMKKYLLEERLLYMYTLPYCLDGKDLRRRLSLLGLECAAEYAERIESPGKPRHKTVVFMKKR